MTPMNSPCFLMFLESQKRSRRATMNWADLPSRRTSKAACATMASEEDIFSESLYARQKKYRLKVIAKVHPPLDHLLFIDSTEKKRRGRNRYKV